MRVLEEGIVRSASHGSATVVMSQGENSACASCGLCGKNKDARVMSLDASAYPGLAVGDHVRIEINRASPYLAVWLMLAQPLVLLVAGIFVGMKLGAAILGEGWKGLSGVACAILLVALNYAVVAWLDRRFFSVRRAHARIVDIIP